MNPDLPPPNRASGWYRFMLWMMPTCIALTTAFGFGWLTTIVRFDPNFLLFGWFLFNTLSTLGIGYFEVNLRNYDPSLSIGTRSGMVGFFFLQILIVPAISFAIFFAACLLGNF